MESMTIGKTVAKKCGDESGIMPSNELVGLGSCNLLCAFMHGFPVTGSFSRTAVNGDAGASTSLALIFCAVLVIIGLIALTPILAFMPKFCLAAIVIEAVVKLVAVGEMKHLWRTDRKDFFVLFSTFLLVLFISIEVGLVIGILFAWIISLLRGQGPTVAVLGLRAGDQESKGAGAGAAPGLRDLNRKTALEAGERLVVAITMYNNFDFVHGAKILDSAKDILVRYKPAVLMLDVNASSQIDSSGMAHLNTIVSECRKQGVPLVLLGAKPNLVENLEVWLAHEPKYDTARCARVHSRGSSAALDGCLAACKAKAGTFQPFYLFHLFHHAVEFVGDLVQAGEGLPPTSATSDSVPAKAPVYTVTAAPVYWMGGEADEEAGGGGERVKEKEQQQF
jgi:SulP family sulfate permease